MAQLTLTLLGGFEARFAAGRPLVLAKKTQALVAYLALAPKQARPRAELATLRWGDTGRAQSQQSLRQALAALRRALDRAGGRILKIDAATLALDRSNSERSGAFRF